MEKNGMDSVSSDVPCMDGAVSFEELTQLVIDNEATPDQQEAFKKRVESDSISKEFFKAEESTISFIRENIKQVPLPDGMREKVLNSISDIQV